MVFPVIIVTPDRTDTFVHTLDMMLRDWPVGTLLGAVLLFCALFLAGAVLYGCFVAVDTAFQPRLERRGTVTDKSFTPAYTQMVMVFNAATKTSMPTFIHHPDTWTVTADIGIAEEGQEVSERLFDAVATGDPVVIGYTRGRLSGHVYFTDIRQHIA